MIRRFLSRFVVRLLIVAVLFVLIAVQGWAGAVLGWAAFVYLFWRAWPGVSRDFRRAWRGAKFHTSDTSRF